MRITAIVSGVEYPLIYPLVLVDWDNLGMAPLHRLSERGPQQHGDSDLGYLLDPRFPTLAIGAAAQTPAGLWDLRSQLIGIFKPDNSIILKAELDNGDVRYLDCKYYDGMSMPSQDRTMQRHQKVGVILKAGDPTFYDPNGAAITFELGGGSGVFAVPLTVPVAVGASTIDQTTIIAYAGNAPTLPTIRITGPITNPTVENESLGFILDFTGITIASGDYYDIDLRYASKTVVNSTGVDKLADLTNDSDHAVWHIAADPAAPGGLNSIRVTGSSADANSQVEISYFDRYLGI